MKKFEINFRGNPIPGGGPGNNFEAWFKMEGDPIEIGRALGEYASGAMVQKQDVVIAKILLNAYRVFRLKHPEITDQIEKSIAGETDGRIVKPFSPFGKPYKA
jgi:hypothetical protein